jgi:xanthine dehydrogenase YagR molybdenum-binding subunit
MFDWDAPTRVERTPATRQGHGGAGLGRRRRPAAYAIVKINGDGSADVLTGTQDLGTGSRTILAQIAAEALGAARATCVSC